MSSPSQIAPDPGGNISEREIEDIEDRARLRARVIYEIVRLEGSSDMHRPLVSLGWSGIAAGLSISFSLLTQSLLTMYLPAASWRPLLTSLGYPVGFVMVVMSRQQLFTESTITVVLPLLARFNRHNLILSTRMWTVVFSANMVGTLVAAAFCSFTPALTPEVHAAMLEVSRHSMLHFAWDETLLRGVSAGFLMAAMVWLIPSAKGSEFMVVLVMTYLISLGNFSHIVAGSVEGFMLVFSGDWSFGTMVWMFMVPTLLGNVIGGTALFALISYAQVMEEM
jgi:formate/nitrite transporter FocA (FNT family)